MVSLSRSLRKSVINVREVGVYTKPNSCITWMCLLIIIKIAFSAFAIFTTLDAFLQLVFPFFTFDKMFKIDFEAKYRLLWCFGPFRAFSLAQSCISLYKIEQAQKSFVQVYWCRETWSDQMKEELESRQVGQAKQEIKKSHVLWSRAGQMQEIPCCLHDLQDVTQGSSLPKKEHPHFDFLQASHTLLWPSFTDLDLTAAWTFDTLWDAAEGKLEGSSSGDEVIALCLAACVGNTCLPWEVAGTVGETVSLKPPGLVCGDKPKPEDGGLEGNRMDKGEDTHKAEEGPAKGEGTLKEGFEMTMHGTWKNSIGYAAPSVMPGGSFCMVFSTPCKRVGILLSQSEVMKERTLLQATSIATSIVTSESSKTVSQASL